MHTILGDGETKVGKSSITKAIIDGLRPHYSFQQAEAGQFFRKLTAAVLDRLPAREPGRPIHPADLEATLKKVIADGVAYDPDYSWGDLERHEIGLLVSKIGEKSQKAAQEWYRRTATMALESGVDVLVLNGRNPRARLSTAETGIPAEELGVCLELVIQCDIDIAGLRWARALYGDSPTEEQIRRQVELVKQRRAQDRERTDLPYVDPENMLQYGFDVTKIDELLKTSWSNAKGVPPRPIAFDNSFVSPEVMTKNIQALVNRALHCITQ